MRVFLIGPMAAGKTTVGRQLADSVGLGFADADQEIEARCGVPITTIFDFEGEAGFRAREGTIIDELTHRCDIVVATGGGAVLDETNRRRLDDRGTVVYLWVPVSEQLRRTDKDRSRPLLHVADRREQLERLQRERDPLYRAIADHIVATQGRPRMRVVDEIASVVKQQNEG